LIRTVLLFGGRSAEHEVSILSARSIAEAAPKNRIEIIPVCVARDGRFIAPDRSARILAEGENSDRAYTEFSFETWARAERPDLVFPIIHGTDGEDGTLQGYLEMIGLPYAGSGVAASAIGMDKGHMKHVFAAAKLPMADFVEVRESDWRNDRERILRAMHNALRLPYFVKPANTGSSVGVVKVKNDADLGAAVENAFRFDDKALVERGVDAREIEIALLGNDDVAGSVLGEIIPGREFYDYEDKYADGKAQTVIPAKMPKEKADEVRRLAITAFKVIGAAGFARADFFLERGTNRIFINEINTLPGFTTMSMYPKLWEATEMKYPRLVERLIELGLERGRARAARREGAMKWFEEVKKIV
jgi:D-alanine-D-alanine ligase